MFVGLTTAHAARAILPHTPETMQQQKDALAQAQAHLQWLQQKNQISQENLTQLQKSVQTKAMVMLPRDINKHVIERVTLDLILAHANLDGANIAKTEAQQAIDATQANISELQNDLQQLTLAAGKTQAVKPRLLILQNQLNYHQSLLKIQQDQYDAIKQGYEIAQATFVAHEELKNNINKLSLINQQRRVQEKYQIKIESLQQQQQKWLRELAEINKRISVLDQQGEKANKSMRAQLEIDVLEAQEMSNLSHLQLVLARLTYQLSVLGNSTKERQTVTAYNTTSNQLRIILNEAENIKAMVNRKLALLANREVLDKKAQNLDLVTQNDFKSSNGMIKKLQAKYQQVAKEISTLEDRIRTYQLELQQNLNRALARRQGMPGLSVKAWASLGQKLVLMPSLAVQSLNALKDQMVIAFHKLHGWRVAQIVILEVLLFIAWLSARKFITAGVKKIAEHRTTLADNTAYVCLQLIARNLQGLFVFAGIVLLFFLSQISFKSFTPIISLWLVWFIFKFAIGLARLTLLETVSSASGHDVILYRNLKWVLLAGGVLTMLTVLSHQLPVGFEVRDFFNRMFMLFLLVTSIILLRGWKVVPTMLASFIDGSRPYLMRVVKIMCLLIPLTVFSTAVIGLLGYVDLAWSISKHEGIFILVLSGYILLRGFLNDLMDWLSEFFIRRLRNGWLWTQAILRPLDRILKLGLLAFAVFLLFILYDWGRGSFLVTEIDHVLNYTLIDMKGSPLTLMKIVEFIIASIILFWVARWTREFSYRWLFSKTRDIGARNSFSAFTQYAVVAVGVLIALDLIGIDLTGISYILGGLAIGVGFGLRDLARNYVSGILLLVERPVRAGDLVSIGNFEGEVTHIGMRSMTVKTWDHMEVLVPNSETFEKSFMNWTHQDSIVRTVISLKISRLDSPLFVQELAFGVLKEIPAVVSDPAPQVFMKDIDDTLIEFEVRYFINLQQCISRAAVRSEVLFALWQCFYEHNIHPPYPQQDLHVKSLPQS